MVPFFFEQSVYIPQLLHRKHGDGNLQMIAVKIVDDVLVAATTIDSLRIMVSNISQPGRVNG